MKLRERSVHGTRSQLPRAAAAERPAMAVALCRAGKPAMKEALRPIELMQFLQSFVSSQSAAWCGWRRRRSDVEDPLMHPSGVRSIYTQDRRTYRTRRLDDRGRCTADARHTRQFNFQYVLAFDICHMSHLGVLWRWGYL